MMHTYQVNVAREDKWWMIAVPELDRYVTADGSINLSDTTQARRLAEVAGQARDFICTVTDKAPSEVVVNITITVDGIDVTGRAGKVINDRELADRYAATAQAEAKTLPVILPRMAWRCVMWVRCWVCRFSGRSN